MNMIPCDCEKPETEDDRIRLTGICINCDHKIIKNKGKWLHIGYGKITEKCYNKKENKNKMNKTIMTIGLFIILITLVGCSVAIISYSSQHKLDCQKICLDKDLSLGYVSASSTTVFCHCERKITVEVEK